MKKTQASRRADAKQRSRDRDAKDLLTGRKTRQQLCTENGHFREIAHEPIQWDKMKSTRPKKPKLGRPAREKHVSESRLVARCTEAEHVEATRAAEAAGMSLSDFVRAAVASSVQRKAWVVKP